MRRIPEPRQPTADPESSLAGRRFSPASREFGRRPATHTALCVGLCSVVLAACGRSGSDEAAAPPPPPTVEVQAAEMRSVQPTISLPAVVEALESSRLRPQVSATVIARDVTPGALVEEGDLLYEFQKTDYELALEQARAALAQAEANSQEAIAGWERAQRLQPQGAISQQAYDAAKAARSVAESRIADAKTRIRQAEIDLEHTEVRAPFSGRISIAHYAVGDYVTPTSPEPLCEIVRLDPIYVTVQIDQKLYYELTLKRQERLAQGEDVSNRLRTTIRLPNGSEFPHEGRFVNWDNTATAETGTVGARAEFPNPEGLLLPGNNVVIEGHVDEPVDRIVIPQRAVSQDQQGHFVLVVNGEDAVERRNIEVGVRIGPDWAVREGLEEGDRVIVHGLQLVRQGMKVTPQPLAAAD